MRTDMKNIIRLTGMLAAVAAMTVSCKKSSLENTYESQEERIESFINGLTESDPDIEVVRNRGSYRIILSKAGDGSEDGGTGNEAGDGESGEGTGAAAEKLGKGGLVSFYYAGYVFSGSAPSASGLFATNRMETAVESGWEVTSADYDIIELRLDDSSGLIEGLKNGLYGVSAGEICYIAFSGKYGFGDDIVGSIPANSALIYQIWVKDVENK